MSNLVLTLLIAFCFVLHCYFFIDFFSQFHHSIFVWLRILLLGFFFSGLPLMGSPRSYDPSHRYERLARANFGFFKAFFSNIFLLVFFWFPIYRGIPISYPRSYVWFVDLGWLPSLLEAFLYMFYIFLSYRQVFIPYILLICSTLCNLFYGVSLFN